MRNKRGFTLVELLAMLVILGILMAVAVPNITGILGNQRMNVIKADASNMVESAKVLVAKETALEKPEIQQCYIFTLDYLNTNGDIEKGPNGGDYYQYDSFVLYTKVSSGAGKAKYKYYVRLIEKTDDGNVGFEWTDSDDISELKNDNIVKVNTLFGLEKAPTATKKVEQAKKLYNASAQVKSLCGNPATSEDKVRYFTRTK